MNYRFIKQNTTPTDAESVSRIGKNLGLHPKLVELLFSRGFCDEASIQKFINPAQKDFHDPFLMKGMREAVERIEQAIAGRECVLVYGDYDADGICATAILTLYLVSRGVNVFPYIPSRSVDGYGLSVQSLERLIELAEPDLIITCDCGISAKTEVMHVMDLGLDIIVTDHHEVSDEVPECVVINPKQSDCTYPINTLCGAGVAFKLVAALGGADAAMQYVDLAALATVADLVPLLDENRLIVKLGLMKEHLRAPGYIALLNDLEMRDNLTSGDLAYKVAPRINAAGRMGDAYRAFELLTTDNAARIGEIIAEINTDNQKRKTLCDEMFAEAVEDLRVEDLTDARAVVLTHPSWEKGITGILAARLAGEYRRPAFIIVNSGAHCKGTCRSFGNINVYELLNACSDLLIEFGGHNQAAGFSIEREQIAAFKQRVNAWLGSVPDEEFLPCVTYDIDLSEQDFSLTFAKELELIEPIGNSNARPVFRIVAENLTVTPSKNNYRHTSVTTEKGLNIWAFNYYNQNQFLLGSGEKELALEISLSYFGKKESVKAVLKGIGTETLYIDDAVARANFLKNVSIKKTSDPVCEFYAPERLGELADGKIYGTMFIAGCAETYRQFIRTHAPRYLYHEFIYPTIVNNLTKIMVSPNFDASFDPANYRKIIFLDSPVGDGLIPYLNKRTGAKIYVPNVCNEETFVRGIDISRGGFGQYYDLLRKNADIRAVNVFGFYETLKFRVPDVDASCLMAALLVFNELKLIDFVKEGFGIVLNAGQKAELTESAVYRYLSAAAGGAL